MTETLCGVNVEAGSMVDAKGLLTMDYMLLDYMLAAKAIKGYHFATV